MTSIRDTGRWNYNPRAVDMAGQRFGCIVVLRRVASDGAGRAQWLCRCDCGSSTICLRSSLIAGYTMSCGCLRRKQARINGRIRRASPRHDASALVEAWR
jgi:hypothetical protein